MYDVFFLTQGEPNSESNLRRLQSKTPVKVISNVKGYFNAHKACADASATDMFYVVDSDAWILDDFEFNYQAQEEKVHVWRSINPVNGLKYGHGAVKLFPKSAFLKPVPKVDLTTSLGGIVALRQISNEHRFDYDGYNTWRSAFRECVKLASKVIEFQVEIATNYKLAVWCNIIQSNLYAGLAVQGARAGREYGLKHAGDLDALSLVNNEEWIKTQYEAV